MKNGIFDINHKPEGYYACSRDEMLRFIPQSARRILEVGCGEGFFGYILKSKIGAEVWGIEVYKNAAENAKLKLDKVIIGDIERDELSLPQNYFDCIIFNDVLEHLKYPWDVLKKIQYNLTDKGYVVASIPNLRFLDNIKMLLRNNDWEYKNKGILDKTHLRFFTKKSIKGMFEACGYDIVKIEGIFSKEFYWKFKLFNWIMKNKFEDMKYLQFACVAKLKV